MVYKTNNKTPTASTIRKCNSNKPSNWQSEYGLCRTYVLYRLANNTSYVPYLQGHFALGFDAYDSIALNSTEAYTSLKYTVILIFIRCIMGLLVAFRGS